MLRRAMRRPLAEMLQEHMSSVVAQWQVAESWMRAARVLQCLDQRPLALRAIRTVLRLVGYTSAPPVRQQCTYPGCNEMSKDACNIFSRMLFQQVPCTPPQTRTPKPETRNPKPESQTTTIGRYCIRRHKAHGYNVWY